MSGHLTGFAREIRGFVTWPGSIWPSDMVHSAKIYQKLPQSVTPARQCDSAILGRKYCFHKVLQPVRNFLGPNGRARRSPANAMANYGRVEKSLTVMLFGEHIHGGRPATLRSVDFAANSHGSDAGSVVPRDCA